MTEKREDGTTARKCWKCSSLAMRERRTRVGRLRTTAAQILAGEEDLNTYRAFLVCADCGHRCSPHEDSYLRNVVHHARRNERIGGLAARFVKAGQPAFVYAERIEHAGMLRDAVRAALVAAALDPMLCDMVHGSLASASNNGAKSALREGRLLVVVGTKVWGEGTDVPNMRWVINASANLPGIALSQLVGRALRRVEGKFRAGYVDFSDKHDPGFAERARSRMKYLRAEGFPVRELSPSAGAHGRTKFRSEK